LQAGQHVHGNQPGEDQQNPSWTVASDFRSFCQPVLMGDVVQDLLAYAASCPMPVPDRAGGLDDPDRPGVMRIPLVNTDGTFALIDAEDYPLVKRYRWRLHTGEKTGTRVVASCATSEQIYATVISMHRLVMLGGPTSLFDHRNHDALDNRKGNLRPCTPSQNSWNTRTSSSNKSGEKGVYMFPSGIVLATVWCDRVAHRKCFETVPEAAAWARKKREELHGEFACHG